MLSRAQVSLPGARRAVVIGAGSFGSAIAVLLARAGVRTTLQTRTERQAVELNESRVNEAYLSGVELPSQLRIEAVSQRRVACRLRLPGGALDQPRAGDRGAARPPASDTVRRSSRSPRGSYRRTARRRPRCCATASGRTASRASAGPPTRRRWSTPGPALVAAAFDEALAEALAAIFNRAGVVCELSNDPIGVELAGVAKNAAALAAGATEAQGLNAAGAAAGHIFAEVWRLRRGGRRAPGVLHRPGRGGRSRRHRARADEPQPPRRRTARRGRRAGRDPGPRRAGRRGARVGAAARRTRSSGPASARRSPAGCRG